MSKLEKLMGRKLTKKDDAQNAARVASLQREAAITPGEEFTDEMARKGFGRKLYRAPGTKRWLRQPPADGRFESSFRYRANDGHGKLTRAAEAVAEAYSPAWREGTNRALGQPVEAKETRVARGVVGVFARQMTQREAARFCERCERRMVYCECA